DQLVYASRLGASDSGRSEDAVAVDGILHLMGHRVCRMGPSPEHLSGAACQAGCVTCLQWPRTHSVSSLGGRIRVCITTQYCSVFSCNPRSCSGVAVGAATSKRR